MSHNENSLQGVTREYIGIKIGDVKRDTGSYVANPCAGNPSQNLVDGRDVIKVTIIWVYRK